MRAGRFGGSSGLQGRTATGGRWGGSRSSFGPQSGGGGGVAAPVLTLVVDDLEQDPPVYLFDCDVACDGYWDFHSSATPPAVGAGDIGTGTFALIAGENSFDVDLSEFASQTGYLHFRGINGGGESNILTSQVITVALVDIPELIIPHINFGGGTIGADNNLSGANVTTTGHYWGYGFTTKEAMMPNYVGTRIAGTSTPALTVSVESIDPATGEPNASTVYATVATDAGGGVTAISGTTTSLLWPMTSVTEIPANTAVFVKFAWKSGAPLGKIGTHGAYMTGTGSPYEIVNTGSVTRRVLSPIPYLTIGISATSFYEIPWAIQGVVVGATTGLQNAAFNNTNGARRGLRFSFPRPIRLMGVAYWNQNNTGDFKIQLYDDAATPALITNGETTIDASTMFAGTQSTYRIPLSTKLTLNANTYYNLVIEPSSATNCSMGLLTFLDANYRSASPWGNGWTGHYVTYASSTWDRTATDKAPLLGLIIDQI